MHTQPLTPYSLYATKTTNKLPGSLCEISFIQILGLRQLPFLFSDYFSYWHDAIVLLFPVRDRPCQNASWDVLPTAYLLTVPINVPWPLTIVSTSYDLVIRPKTVCCVLMTVVENMSMGLESRTELHLKGKVPRDLNPEFEGHLHGNDLYSCLCPNFLWMLANFLSHNFAFSAILSIIKYMNRQPCAFDWFIISVYYIVDKWEYRQRNCTHFLVIRYFKSFPSYYSSSVKSTFYQLICEHFYIFTFWSPSSCYK